MTNPAPDDAQAFSPAALLAVLLRRRVGIIRTALVLGLLVGVMILVRSRQYSAYASFTPQARRQPSAISGLAAQFGLAVPTQDGAQSPAFYVDLLLSREILGTTVMERFPVTVDGAKRDTVLADYLGAKGKNAEELRERGILEMKDRVGASANLKTGVVTLTVTTRDPGLSAAVTKRLLAALDSFNQQRRKSQATAERQFTERRLAEVRAELRDAEDRQQAFLQRNRDYRGSPELAFQHDRLAREVAMRQTVYTSLAQAFEQSKIDEVRDTPVLSLVEEPDVPPFPVGRGLVRYTITATILGGVGAAIAFLALALAIPGSRPTDEMADLREAWLATRADLKRPLQALIRR